MYYITDMSAMQTKNKKNKKIYLLPFWPQKQGKIKGVLLKATHPAMKIQKSKHALSTVEWLRIMKPRIDADKHYIMKKG